jgi:hypothetical protein
MGDTVSFLRDSLTAAKIESCSPECASSGCGKACWEKVAKLMQARSDLLGKLTQLADQTGSLAKGSESSCRKEQTLATAASAATSCDKTAAVATGDSCKSSAKATVASKSSFCPNKAQSLATSVRGAGCEKTAAKTLMAAIPGLACEKKAASLVTSVRGAGCEKSAASLIVAAADDCGKTCDKAAGCCSAGGCTGGSCKGGTAKASAKSGGCQKSVDTAAGLASRAQTLARSWERAPAEYAALSDAQRRALHAGVQELVQSGIGFDLMPDSMHALTEGVAAVVAIDGHVFQVVGKDRTLPAEKVKAFEKRAALVKQAHDVLLRVDRAMKAMAPKHPKAEAF